MDYCQQWNRSTLPSGEPLVDIVWHQGTAGLDIDPSKPAPGSHTSALNPLMDALHGHALLDDLDLAAKSQWVGKGKNNQRCMLPTSK